MGNPPPPADLGQSSNGSDLRKIILPSGPTKRVGVFLSGRTVQSTCAKVSKSRVRFVWTLLTQQCVVTPPYPSKSCALREQNVEYWGGAPAHWIHQRAAHGGRRHWCSDVTRGSHHLTISTTMSSKRPILRTNFKTNGPGTTVCVARCVPPHVTRTLRRVTHERNVRRQAPRPQPGTLQQSFPRDASKLEVMHSEQSITHCTE